MRRFIKLPDVPSELLRPAREDDDDDIKLARWRALLSYFSCSSIEAVKEAKKLILDLAALLFPAFRAPATKKTRGRPRGVKKYEDPFLLQFANVYEIFKRNNTGVAALSDRQLFAKLKKKNESIANKLQVGGRDIKFSTAKALISKGRRLRIGSWVVVFIENDRPIYVMRLLSDEFYAAMYRWIPQKGNIIRN
jgi:hypothetical protein